MRLGSTNNVIGCSHAAERHERQRKRHAVEEPVLDVYRGHMFLTVVQTNLRWSSPNRRTFDQFTILVAKSLLSDQRGVIRRSCLTKTAHRYPGDEKGTMVNGTRIGRWRAGLSRFSLVQIA